MYFIFTRLRKLQIYIAFSYGLMNNVIRGRCVKNEVLNKSPNLVSLCFLPDLRFEIRKDAGRLIGARPILAQDRLASEMPRFLQRWRGTPKNIPANQQHISIPAHSSSGNQAPSIFLIDQRIHPDLDSLLAQDGGVDRTRHSFDIVVVPRTNGHRTGRPATSPEFVPLRPSTRRRSKPRLQPVGNLSTAFLPTNTHLGPLLFRSERKYTRTESTL